MTDPQLTDASSQGLHEGLQKFEAQWKRLQMRLGAGRFLIMVIVLLGIAGALDGALGLEGRSRLLMTLLFYVGVGLSAWMVWLRYLFRPLSPESVAWMIESVHPELNEKLISAVELEKEKGRTVSRAMIVRMIRETEMDIGKVDPARDLAPPKWLRVLPFAVAALVVILMAVPGFYLPLRMKRIVLPASHDAAVTTVRLQWVSMPPDLFPEDGEIQVAVTRSEDRNEPVVLEIQGEQNRRIPLKWNSETQAFEGSFEGPDHEVVLFARSGKASTRRVSMSPMLRPWIEALTLTVTPPAYTGAEVQEFDRFPHEVFAVAGSGIQVTLTANEELASAFLETEGGKVDLALHPDGSATGQLKPEAGGELVLRLIDREGLTPKESPRVSLKLMPDRPPQLVWVSPQNDVLMREGDGLPLVWSVEDDYGVSESRVWIQKNEDQPVIKTMEAVDGDYRLDFSDWFLGGGDRLRVRAMAKDALGQEGETPVRTLSVAGGLDHPDAQVYLRDLDQVKQRLESRTADANALQDARGGLFEAAEYRTPTATENLEYNTSRWELLSREMDLELNALRSGLDGLRARAFFAPGDEVLELLSAYSEQERRLLFRTDPAKLQEGPGVEGVWELGVPALAELRLRSGYALPALQAEKLATMVAVAAPRKDPASRRLLMDLRHRAAVFAQEHAPDRVETLEGLDLSMPEASTPGLIREMWKGRNTYVLDPVVTAGDADKVPNVNHPELTSMGVSREQRMSVRWRGTIEIKKGGEYGFELESDDGSRLYVNDTLVVKNDGNHSMQKKQGTLRLSPGVHPIRIVYFNSGGGGGIVFRWRAPGSQEWNVVPDQVLGSQFDEGAARLVYETRNMVRRLERQAYDLRALKRMSDQIRRRLKHSSAPLLEQLAERQEAELSEQEIADVTEEAEALKSRAEVEGSDRLLQVAEEVARAAEQGDREAAVEALKAAEQVLADQEQESWEKSVREELDRAMQVVKQSESLRNADEPLQRRDLEQLAEMKEAAERLNTLADQAPETEGDRALEEAVKNAAREAERVAQTLDQAVSNPESLENALADVETRMQTAEERLDLAAEAAEERLQRTEDRLKAARADEAQQMAELLERLEDLEKLDPVAALEALQAEQAALEQLVSSMRALLDLQRESDETATASEVRDQRLADALEHQAGQKLQEVERALRQKDPTEASEALAEASRQLEEVQPLLDAQQRAENLALTEQEEAELSEAIREATDPVLPEAVSAAYDAWEQMAEARENVEKLSEELQQLQAARGQTQLDPFAEKVASTAEALKPQAAPDTNDGWDRQEQKAMEDAMRRLQPMQHAAARAEAAEEAGKAESEGRKSLEKLSRRSEEFRAAMERHAGPESRRLQEMADAVERQARAEDREGAEQTLEAMERQIEQWAKEAGEAGRTQREEMAEAGEAEETLARLAQAADALENAQTFEEQVEHPLKNAPQLAERGEFERLARTMDATGEAPELVEQAEALEQKKRDLQQAALRQAMKERDRNKRQRLERAAEKLAANDLRDAASQLKNAGRKDLQKQAETLREEGRKLAEAAKEKAEQVAKESGPTVQAQQAMEKAVAALEQEEKEVREASTQEQGEGRPQTTPETAAALEKQEALKEAVSLAEKAQQRAEQKKWKEAGELARESEEKAGEALKEEGNRLASAETPSEKAPGEGRDQNQAEPQGQQGQQGEQTAQQGQPGEQGQQGEQNQAGQQGQQGQQGEQTAQQGQPGEQGQQGEQNQAGQQGQQGQQGEQTAQNGQPGEQGQQGEQNQAGQQGQQGEQGEQTAQKGQPGEQGQQGEQSQAGQQGQQGEQGAQTAQQGQPGERGQQGEQSAQQAQQGQQSAQQGQQIAQQPQQGMQNPQQGQLAQEGLSAQQPIPGLSPEGPSDMSDMSDLSQPLDDAVALLNLAEEALRDQETSLAGESLNQAVAALSGAEQAMAAMMSDLAQSASSPSQASQSQSQSQSQAQQGQGQGQGQAQGQGQSSTLSQSQGGGGGQGGSTKESERGLDEDPGEVPEGEAWDGAVSDLNKGDRQRGSNRYSPYYRRAMQQYMQDLQKEQQE